MIPPPITIRPALIKDAKAISALLMSLKSFTLDDPDDSEAAFLDFIQPKAIREFLRDPRYRYFVAETEGAVRRLAGVVAVRDDSHLFHLFVGRDFHRQGLATRLWQIAKADAEAHGNNGTFTVNSSDYAVPVYERFGFVIDGERESKDGVSFVPMVLKPPEATEKPSRGLRRQMETFSEKLVQDTGLLDTAPLRVSDRESLDMDREDPFRDPSA